MLLDPTLVERVLEASLPPGLDGVSGVTHDSRRVEPGFAFVAVPGFKRDGLEFVEDALRKGAALVVAERPLPGPGNGAPVVVVPNARAALAALACAVFEAPSEALEVYGVTGTNGKTTTSYALYSVLAGAFGEAEVGLMTTAEVVSGGRRRPAAHTTPEAVEVQKTLAEMRDAGTERVVMEVSSHGIALDRVSGTRFSGALFTNLTRDHLDLHGTMEDYYATKRKLFYRSAGPKLANADDAYGRRLAGEVEGTKTLGTTNAADYQATEVKTTSGGTAFSLRYGRKSLELRTPLLGSYNVLNVAGAVAFALEVGVEAAAVARAVQKMPQVPGRFERVAAAGERGFEVIVDYAHTDVGLEAVLEVARGVVQADGGVGRVICVFGAAGERDGAKRPLMGRVASKLADQSIITTDDAYGEDPAKIAAEVAVGTNRNVNVRTVLDRREAIRQALNEARSGDVVVVAGKGHERVQHLPEGDVPFHDTSVVAEELSEMPETQGR